MLNAGVLLALPSLISQGLGQAFTTYNPLPNGFYGLHHFILLSCLMALASIKNPEQLKNYPPGELGKLLGLDRVPEVGHFRKKLKQLMGQGKSATFHTKLFNSWMEKKPTCPNVLFHVNGYALLAPQAFG